MKNTSALGSILLLAVGTPNACIDVKQDEVVTVGLGSWNEPEIVRRDNLAVGGQLDIKDKTASSTVSSAYLTDGHWKNVGGHFQLAETRENYWPYVNQYTPILPRDNNWQGPGLANYGTRAGVLVHDNKYLVQMNAWDSAGESFAASKYVQLSKDTMLVPVVVVSWKGGTEFTDERLPSAAMFDFNFLSIPEHGSPLPYWRPDHSMMQPLPLKGQYPLALNSVDAPDPNFFQILPDREEIPPDDIWEKCNIQFQVVGELVANLPADWQNYCHVQSYNLPDPALAVAQQVGKTMAAWLEKLKPVYVSYGPLELCASGWGSDSFYGTTPGKENRIEITFRRPPTITAHELGHALDLDHAEDVQGKPIEGNLMRDDPDHGERELTDAQCQQAREGALAFSMRFDQFNRDTGRTWSATAPIPPADPSGDVGDIDSGGGNLCCPSNGDASLTSTCRTKPVALSQCRTVCCGASNNGSNMSFYKCSALGWPYQEGPCPLK